MTLLLTRADVRRVLTLDDCIAAVEDAFRAYGERRLTTPASLGVPALDGGFHVKAALSDVFAAKINANFPSNPRRGLPTIQGLIVIMDAECGTPLGVLDSAEITIMRTAAATAVAAKVLARDDARVLTLAGCGAQARLQLEAVMRVRPIEQVFGFDSNPSAAELFVRETSSLPGIEVHAVGDLAGAVRRSDIVITCTTSRTPILSLEHLHDGVFIAAVGADNPEKNEIAPDLLAASRVVTDVTAQAASMGDLHHAITAGVMTAEDVYAELADVICGRVSGRAGADETFVFDSTGTALQDVAAASIALRRAESEGIGLHVAFA